MKPRVPLWAVAVFASALAARLLFVLVADEPLLYAHQYHYFTSALRLAESPQMLHEVLFREEWRTWDANWTIAPLYHLFLATWFRVVGAALLPLRLAQCVFDALAAVAVASLGRRVAGPRGAWAGIAYAFWWPAVEIPSWTMTENIHTPLFTAAVAMLAWEVEAPRRSRAFLGGLLIGLSALARSVSTGFLLLAVAWRLVVGRRAGLPSAALILAGGLTAILPWTARNVFLVGDRVLIESAAFENLWWANNFVDRQRFERQTDVIRGLDKPADKRAAALQFAVRGVRRNPGAFVDKVRTNFWHFLRPEGLHSALRVQRSLEPWRHAGLLLLDDPLIVVLVPLVLVFFLAGRPTPTWGLLGIWMGYYLFMIVVVFHNEIRYRSAFVPFALAAAAGGVATLADPARRRSLRTWIAVAVGVVIAFRMVAPYAPDAWRAVAARRALSPERDPRSPRPWFDQGRAALWAGQLPLAAESYERGQALANFANWRGLIGLFRVLPSVGGAEDAARRLRQLDRFSYDQDPWLIQEAAWRELPPPATDEVLLARGDYGAVRDFFHPRGLDPGLAAHRLEWNKYEELGGPLPPPGPHRWSRHTAAVRLRPVTLARQYDVTIEMGVPFPATRTSSEVVVRSSDGGRHAFTVGSEVRPYSFRARAVDGVIGLRLDAPVWNRSGEPADQAVRVDRVSARAIP
jgi:hypothetical protein